MELVKVDLLATVPKIFLLTSQQMFDPKLVTEIWVNLARTPIRPYLSLILVPFEFVLMCNMIKVEVLFQQTDKPDSITTAFYLDNKVDIASLMTPNCYVTVSVCYTGSHIDTNRLLVTKGCSNNSTTHFTPANVNGLPVPTTTSEPTPMVLPKIDELDLLSNPFNLGTVTKTLFGRSSWRTTSIPVQLPPPDTIVGTATSTVETIVGCSIVYTVNGSSVNTMVQQNKEMVFNVGDEFTVFMVVNSGPRSALETYSLILFKERGTRSYMIGSAMEAHMIKVEYVSKSIQSISLFHMQTRKHRTMFSFCVRKPSTKIVQPGLADQLVKRPIM